MIFSCVPDRMGKIRFHHSNTQGHLARSTHSREGSQDMVCWEFQRCWTDGTEASLPARQSLLHQPGYGTSTSHPLCSYQWRRCRTAWCCCVPPCQSGWWYTGAAPQQESPASDPLLCHNLDRTHHVVLDRMNWLHLHRMRLFFPLPKNRTNSPYQHGRHQPSW